MQLLLGHIGDKKAHKRKKLDFGKSQNGKKRKYFVGLLSALNCKISTQKIVHKNFLIF